MSTDLRVPVQQRGELLRRHRAVLQPQLLEDERSAGGRGFSVLQLGFYAGDKWRVAPNFTLTYGARVDLPVSRTSRTPTRSRCRTSAIPRRGPAPTMFSPRVGFNWDMSDNSGKRRQIRGGLGLLPIGRTDPLRLGVVPVITGTPASTSPACR